MIVHQTGVYLLIVIEQQKIIYRYTLMEIHIWSASENDSPDLSDMSKLTSVIDINYYFFYFILKLITNRQRSLNQRKVGI
jgi:hypothetical protein